MSEHNRVEATIFDQAENAQKLAPSITWAQVAALRRCAMTLHRWAELECGDSNNHASWAIERDASTGRPYMCRYPHNSNGSTRELIADRERGALKRARAIAEALGLSIEHQTDPRGAALALVGADGRKVWFYK